jgi:hypothetical protein
MLRLYPHARTFMAATWSTFVDRWNQDCIKNHNHEGENASHNRELDNARVAAKEAELAELAKTRPPPVPISSQDARDLFKRVLGPASVLSLANELQTFVIEDDPPPIRDGPMMYAVSGYSSIFTNRCVLCTRGRRL